MSILSKLAILQAIKKGDIQIDPFDETLLNPNSYDLTIGGDKVIRLDRQGNYDNDKEDWNFEENLEEGFSPDGSIIIYPYYFYLFTTAERTFTPHHVPILHGKSTMARLGVQIHMAGFGDLGFDGMWTLEVTCFRPTKLFKGQRIGQIAFETIEGEINDLYSGKYQNQNEATPAKFSLV